MARCLTRGTVASFVRTYYLSFPYIMNKDIGRFLHFKSCAPFLSFFLSLYIAKQHTENFPSTWMHSRRILQVVFTFWKHCQRTPKMVVYCMATEYSVACFGHFNHASQGLHHANQFYKLTGLGCMGSTKARYWWQLHKMATTTFSPLPLPLSRGRPVVLGAFSWKICGHTWLLNQISVWSRIDMPPLKVPTIILQTVGMTLLYACLLR